MFQTKDELLKLIKHLMDNNKRIHNKVLELNLTNEEAIEALPIMLDMFDENENTKSLYLTSFERNKNNNIKKIDVLSNEGKRKKYLENVKTFYFHPVDFEDNQEHTKLDERKFLINEFAKFLKNDQINLVEKGFYIFGEHGIGKTFILKRFAKKLAEIGRKIGYVQVGNLVSIFQNSFNKSITDNDSKNSLIEVLKNVDYLFIDDIGSEPISSWFRDDILFHILSDRVIQKKATFFTSNYNLENLKNIESKTQKEKYRDIEKAERIINKIKMISNPIFLSKKNIK